MRKLTQLAFLLLIVSAMPLEAARDKHQSYLSYDDGGTVVRQADDAREIEARINLPIFPGDEVITNRRGRAEIRLADGNVVGIDRATAVRFASILDSYEGDADRTVIELRYGKIAVHRTDRSAEYVRLDTQSASYVAMDEAIYSVESDSRGADRVVVLDGAIEVRTPSRTTRIRAGEEARVDDRGMYDFIRDGRTSSDDFERWFVRRAERYNGYESRYLDRSLAYADYELSQHGNWVYITGIGWGWRPTVSVGWRPYYYGHWMRSRWGAMTWVSYDPWGWVPYHYGRWSYDPMQGWFWLPGMGYSPAWVYWWYGNGYLGWAPAGWWEGYRPYYHWAYQPHIRSSLGFGFYGRVRVNDIDLRPWTFIDATHIVSNRVDRAALATDVIRGRLLRDNGGIGTISSSPARFTNEQMQDPAASIGMISRRPFVGDKRIGDPSAEAGLDLTSFIRRDADLPSSIRDRVVRTRDGASDATIRARVGGSSGATSGGGGIAPVGTGSAAPIPRGGLAPVGSGSVAPIGGEDRGTVDRRGGSTTREGGTTVRERIDRGGTSESGVIRRAPAAPQPAAPSAQPAAPEQRNGAPGWRERVGSAPQRPSPGDSGSVSRPGRDTSWRGRDDGSARDASPRGSDVPRRVIDRIGGARVQPAEGSSDGGRRRSGGSVDRGSSPPPRASSGGSSSGGSRGGDSAPSPSSSAPAPSSGGGGGGRSEGGKIGRSNGQ